MEQRRDLLGCGPGAVLYAIVDRIVDDYVPVVAGIDRAVREVEGEVFSQSRSNPAERIYKLKREVLEPHDAVAPLVEPIDAVWIVASIAVGYDEARDRILVVANELLEEEEAGEPASARVLITRAQAAAFVKQADALMKAGREICPWCSQPKDPGVHVCPRSNGHVVH